MVNLPTSSIPTLSIPAFVNIDQMGIDKMGIDKVGTDKVGITLMNGLGMRLLPLMYTFTLCDLGPFYCG